MLQLKIMAPHHSFGLPTLERQAAPFGGWLILLGINLVTLFLRRTWRLYLLYSNVFDIDNFSGLTITNGRVISSSHAPYFVVTIVLNLIVLYAIVRLILLFLAKNKAFLTWFPAVVIAALSISALEVVQLYIFANEPSRFEALVWSGLLLALIPLLWIPYLRKSERVRMTFID